MAKVLNELTIVEAARALRARVCTVRELFDACVQAANAQNAELNAYREIFSDDAGARSEIDTETNAAIIEAQKLIDAEIESTQIGDTEAKKAPMLCGIPIAMKDNILIEGRIASASSKILENYKATYDATVTKKLKEQHAIFIGRTNMDEFALGGSTENSAYGPTKNPHDHARVAGGTSGGSAAAVAAHLSIAALGTDTGGSVRNPASFCGVVGLKPTYGSVSRSGIIAAASSCDQVGPLAKSVADAKILFDVIRGHDPLDATTIPENFSYAAKSNPVQGASSVKSTAAGTEKKASLRIGVPRHLLKEGVDEDVKAQFEKTLKELEAAGHALVDIELPTSSYAIAAYYIINFAEVSTNLSRFDGMRYGLAERGNTLLSDYVQSRTKGFGNESKRRILLGTYVLSAGYIDAYYRKALAARSQLTREYEEAFKNVDAIATPTMPAPAFVIGEKSDPVSMYIEDIFTVTANLTAMPAISVPMGTVSRKGTAMAKDENEVDATSTEKMLPIGIQFTAARGAEEILFTLGAHVTHETL